MIIFEKNSVIWFQSLKERLSDFCRNFRIVLKNAFQVSIGFWWRKKYFKNFFSSWVFSDFEREIFQTLAKFYPSGSWKMQSMPPVEPFEKKIKLQNYCKSSFLRLSKSFWEFWHKLLAWLSNFLSTWTTSVIIIFPTFFQRTTFQIFSEFFFDRAHKHAIFVSGVFSLESINFEKSCCFIFVFFLFLSVSGRSSVFVEFFGRFFKIAFRVSCEIIPG